MSTSGQVVKWTPGERRVFRLIRQRPGISRVELAEVAGLSTGTVTQIVKRLRQDGLADEGEIIESRGMGRSRIGLKPQADPDRVVGISVRPDLIRYVLADWSGAVREERTIACHTFADQSAVIDRIGQSLASAKTGVCALGLATPGFPVSAREHAEMWAEMLGGQLRVPTRVINNGVAAAIAEEWRWLKNPPADFLLVYFGSGIGGALVHRRRFGRVPAIHPVEVGHVGIAPDGERCICGNRGCVETVASPAARVRLGEVEEYWDQAQRALMYALTSAINVLDVADVVLSGLRQPQLEQFYGTLSERLKVLNTPDGTPVTPRMSVLGDECAALGAALAAMDGFAEAATHFRKGDE